MPSTRSIDSGERTWSTRINVGPASKPPPETAGDELEPPLTRGVRRGRRQRLDDVADDLDERHALAGDARLDVIAVAAKSISASFFGSPNFSRLIATAGSRSIGMSIGYSPSSPSYSASTAK